MILARLLFILSLLNVVAISNCWQYFTKFQDLVMTGTHPEPTVIHSEYYFGDCRREGVILYNMVHVMNIDVLGKIIMRGWVDLVRIPTCILLRAYAQEENMFRSTAYPFQMCVPRITYCHSRRVWRYFFYEWYIPTEFYGGMDWDIYFYGPPSLEWH